MLEETYLAGTNYFIRIPVQTSQLGSSRLSFAFNLKTSLYFVLAY